MSEKTEGVRYYINGEPVSWVDFIKEFNTVQAGRNVVISIEDEPK